MRNTTKTAFAAICAGLALNASVAFAEDCQVPSGKTWINELQSEMTLTIDASGAMSGSYTSAVGCGAGKSRALLGFCNGHAVSFAVSWQECGATTAWNGTYVDGTLTTLWQLPQARKPSWDSMLIGTNIFTQK